MILLALLFCSDMALSPLWKVDLGEFEIYHYLSSLAVSPDGVIAIGVRREKKLVFLKPDGSFRSEAGTAGQGPGEFMALTYVVYNDDAQCFFATDWARPVVTKWSVDGDFLGEATVGPQRREARFSSKNTILYIRGTTGTRGSQPALLAQDFDGKEKLIWQRAPLEQTHAYSNDKPAFIFKTILHPELIYDSGRNFSAICYSENDWIELIGPAGEELHRFRVNRKPVSTTDKDIDHALRNRLSAKMLDRFQPYVKNHPKNWPPVSQIFVDEQDRIWVFSKQSFKDKMPYRVFDRKGNLQGEGWAWGYVKAIRDNHFYIYTYNKESELFLEKVAVTK